MPLQNRVTPLGELVADPRVASSTATAAASTTRRAASAAATAASAGSAAGSSSAAGGGERGCCSPAASPSSSSSTRRPRSPRGIVPARTAAGERTTTASREIWRELHPGQVGADAIDAQLHAERVDPGTRGHRLHETRLDELPDGAFVLEGGAPRLVLGAELLAWTPAGYVERNRDQAAKRC